MTKEVYLDISKNDPVNPNRFYYKYYQYNDPKDKFYLCKFWLPNNCTKVIDTPTQSPDINFIENLWLHLKENARKKDR